MIATSTDTAFTTVLSSGAHTLQSDTTIDNGGSNDGFRPHELLEAAVAACMNITARMVAAQEEIPLAGVEVHVALDRSDPDSTEFRIDVGLAGELTDAQRERIVEAVNDCPVRRTLSKRLVFT